MGDRVKITQKYLEKNCRKAKGRKYKKLWVRAGGWGWREIEIDDDETSIVGKACKKGGKR